MPSDPFIDASGAPKPGGRRLNGGRFRLLKWPVILLLIAVFAYYPIGMIVVHKIDDDPDFKAADAPSGASQAVAVEAALIDREVNRNGWISNDPIFLPGSLLDNMPNFQQGMLQAMRRFTLELQDQIGRSRASSSIDPDLQKAVGLLNYSPTVWLWNPSVSLAPAQSSEAQYRAAMRALQSYNDRLGRGQATFEPRADNLQATLDGIGKDLGDASSEIERQIDDNSGNWLDFNADDVFYRAKGLSYAYAIMLRDLGGDFKQVIQEKGATQIWQRLVGSLMEVAALRPWVVVNGRPDALLQPNHLAAEGFYIQRARTQLYELIDILQK
ncbi:MAG TPA: DUF2333 family protein [Dongiaceae bacterium]|nr:DUF2333 family protein [Dongiaceae bacterium]